MDFYINILCGLGVPACNAVKIVSKYFQQGCVEELVHLIDSLEAKEDYAWEGIPCVY